MKRFILPCIVAVCIALVYQFVGIRFFNLNMHRDLSRLAFRLKEPTYQEDIVIVNAGKSSPEDIEKVIDTLLFMGVEVVAVNPCQFKGPERYFSRYRNHPRVVVANCEGVGKLSLSAIVYQGNIVEHFRSDRSDYFEFVVSKKKNRDHDTELINYNAMGTPMVLESNDAREFMRADFENATVFIGYLGDYIQNEGEYRQSMRITPLNDEYQYWDAGIAPDQYDTQISAAIVSTIRSDLYIERFNAMERIAIVLLFTIITALAITLIKTRWVVVNVIIALVVLVIMLFVSSFIQFWLFLSKDYFIELDELPVLLIVITIATLVLNSLNQAKQRKEVSVDPDPEL